MKQEVLKIYTKPYLHAHYQSSTSRQKKQQQNDNGLQGRTIEHQLPTAVLQKWRCCASYDSFVVGSSAVLRLQFSGENRHLRKASKRKKHFIGATTGNTINEDPTIIAK